MFLPEVTDTGLMGLPKRSTKTLDDIASEFLSRANTATTRRAYEYDLRVLGEFSAGDLSDKRMIAFKEWLVATRPARSAKRILDTTRRFLELVVYHGLLPRNPLGQIKAPRVDKMDSPHHALEDGEVLRMLEFPDRSTYVGACQRLSIVLGFFLGLRCAEIVGLTWANLEGDRMHVRGKGNKTRIIPLPEGVLRELGEFLDAFTLYHGRAPEASGPLLASRHQAQESVDASTVYRWYVGIAQSVGIEKKVTPHCARATAITKLLDNGVPLRDAANMAGHNSVDTTMIYDKRRGSVSLDVVNKIKY